MKGHILDASSQKGDTRRQELPSQQNLRDLLLWSTVRPSRWANKTIKDLNSITLEQPDLVFPKGVLQKNGEFYEYHFNELFIGVQVLAGEVFGGGEHRHFYRTRSPWVHEYPEEFYEYVKSVAHPDPNAKQWEHLLRTQIERMMLVNGIVWKALHANVLSSLMFGASNDHEQTLSAHDHNLMNVEGFTQSTVLAETNAAYLQRNPDYMPPHFWERVSRVSSQLVQMLLPLYNVCGNRFSEKPPALQDFAQATFNIVAYAGWLNLINRLSPGVINIIWSGPGSTAFVDEKMVLEIAYEKSKARAEVKDKQPEGNARHEKRVKICAAPAIARLSLDEARPNHHKFYLIQQPHVVYYSGMEHEREHMALADYVESVRRPPGLPPSWLILLILAVFGTLLSLIIENASRQAATHRLPRE